MTLSPQPAWRRTMIGRVLTSPWTLVVTWALVMIFYAISGPSWLAAFFGVVFGVHLVNVKGRPP